MRALLRTVAALAAVSVAGAALAAPAAAAQGPGAPSSAQASVIGGRVASIAEFPWLAFVQGKTEEVPGTEPVPFSCTGTVVAPRVVLTAGHCVEKEDESGANPASGYSVTTSVANVKGAMRSRVSSVSRVSFFPRFETAKLQTDAGLLILPAPVAAPPLPIASLSDSRLLAAGTPISIAGWGFTRPDAGAVPAALHAGTLSVKPPGYCRRQSSPTYPYYSTAAQLCALDTPGEKVSGCFGDSGGPAIARRPDGTPVEIGIIIGGGPGCSRKLPNIYTRVDRISAWVSAWIATVEQGAPRPPTPKVSPPRLTFSLAKIEGFLILGRAFHDHFLSGDRTRAGCARIRWEKVRCGIAWHHDGNLYHGSFAIQLLVEGTKLVPNYSYVIHWVDSGCRSRSADPKTCAVHTRARVGGRFHLALKGHRPRS